MKRKLSLIMTVIVIMMSLAACGSSGGNKYATDEYAYEPSYSSGGGYVGENEDAQYTNAGSDPAISQVRDPRKIIYTANLRIDTIEFDKSYQTLTDSVRQFGGYVQDSYLNAGNYYSSQSRSLDMTVRIPAENYEAFLLKRTELGVVVYFNESTQDVTGEYIDIQARIETLRTQEERLMQLISQAKDLEEMLLLEDKLSDVRYQIESAQGRIKVYDDLISYCTVTVTLNEVEKASNVNTGFGYKLGQAFISSWAGFINALQDIVIALVSILPLLLIIGIAAFFIIKAVKKRQKSMPMTFAKMPPAAQPAPEEIKKDTLNE